MTPLEIADSMYFYKDELRLTTPDGKYSTTVDAVFSQTVAMLEDCSANEIRSITNELIIAFERGIKLLETLEMGKRQEKMRHAGY